MSSLPALEAMFDACGQSFYHGGPGDVAFPDAPRP